MAALTMSFDQNACRYAAAVQTNGHRVEMITPANIRSMMLPLFEQWITKVGGGRGPGHIYYFRDGVSEGQYAHVLNNELADMKEALAEKYGAQVAGGVSPVFGEIAGGGLGGADWERVFGSVGVG